MSNSEGMFSEGRLIGPDHAKRVAEERAVQTEDEVKAEIARYTSLVFGAKPLVPPKLAVAKHQVEPMSDKARITRLEQHHKQVSEFNVELIEAMRRFIAQNVIHMRGIALQAQQVNRVTVDAAGMANMAWDTTQKLLEVHSARQGALNRYLRQNEALVDACLGFSGQDIKPGTPDEDMEDPYLLRLKKLMEDRDVDSAAAPDKEAVGRDIADATNILVAKARAEAGKGGKIITGGQGAADMTATALRQHGEGLAQRAAQGAEKFTDRIIRARR